MRRDLAVLAVLCGIVTTSVARATDYNDVVTDFSNDFASPTMLSLTTGSNVLTGRTGTQGGLDRDHFRITVPVGQQLQAIRLLSTNTPSLSHFAVQTTNCTNPATATQAQLLGYLHFGQSLVGTDILDNMGVGAGAPLEELLRVAEQLVERSRAELPRRKRPFVAHGLVGGGDQLAKSAVQALERLGLFA